ncbi:hypothetical protein BCR32DRAFT_273624 [Anaeromyces robustus]|uniref:Periplasmic binding protein-like II n=1 Tax=Anaeromyces robustus TaxID=1754192 RepID=A0A1Y1V699_9FUNG|nr:hypothetical protein BCR32DRAFT_273624 [Anaeromyces robustus]|eukprot:ORX47393.1 hypothetical protein BCR32DRAFT_273624 [Anaeromyces robustus]
MYSKNNDLDIYLNRTSISANVKLSVSDYTSYIELLFKKRSTKYDLIMINSVFTYKFEKYTSDLRQYVLEDIINNYKMEHIWNVGFHNNKLVGLPLYLDVGVLYTNQIYINKYNKTIPKTWDELIETASYILEKEKEIGNTDMAGYLGYFPDADSEVCSFLEFVHGFRDKLENDIPEYRSNNAINSLNKIKEIKKKISSGIII